MIEAPVRSAVESNRFGIEIFRWQREAAPSSLAFLEALADAAVDLVIIRFPTNRLDSAADLMLSPIPTLFAGTSVEYVLDLRGWTPRDFTNGGLTFIPLDTSFEHDLEQLVRVAFGEYRNHYTANPLLDEGASLDGYVEWAAGSLDHPAQSAFGVAEGDRLVAFATTSRNDDEVTILLNGVAPDRAGRQIYGDLIIGLAEQLLSTSEVTKVRIVTQSENIAVQRAWARLGFSMVASESTVHAMPLFGAANGSARRSDRRRLSTLQVGPQETVTRIEEAHVGSLNVARSYSPKGLMKVEYWM